MLRPELQMETQLVQFALEITRLVRTYKTTKSYPTQSLFSSANQAKCETHLSAQVRPGPRPPGRPPASLGRREGHREAAGLHRVHGHVAASAQSVASHGSPSQKGPGRTTERTWVRIFRVDTPKMNQKLWYSRKMVVFAEGCTPQNGFGFPFDFPFKPTK